MSANAAPAADSIPGRVGRSSGLAGRISTGTSVPWEPASASSHRAEVPFWRGAIGHHEQMSPDDERTIRECLRAAVDGPFLPDREFQTLIGLERNEVAVVLADWPETSNSEDQALAVNNVLNNLVGYPHGASDETWHSYIEASPEDVAAVFARWRAERGIASGAAG
jgi:hypothetical protein